MNDGSPDEHLDGWPDDHDEHDHDHDHDWLDVDDLTALDVDDLPSWGPGDDSELDLDLDLDDFDETDYDDEDLTGVEASEVAPGSTPAPVAAARLWTDALGPGGVDPAGTQDATFAGLEQAEDLDGWFDQAASDTDPGLPPWLAASDADPETWLPADVFGPASGVAGSTPEASWGSGEVEALWSRLAPDEAMPTRPDATIDHEGALDVLASRTGSRAGLAVVTAARRLLRP